MTIESIRVNLLRAAELTRPLVEGQRANGLRRAERLADAFAREASRSIEAAYFVGYREGYAEGWREAMAQENVGEPT